jgi:hypothetical protein
VPTSDSDPLVHALRELVDALDRRVAHVERLGETRIAPEAVALREEAVNRIHELTAAMSDREAREAEWSGGVMADHGGPLGPENWQELLVSQDIIHLLEAGDEGTSEAR